MGIMRLPSRHDYWRKSKLLLRTQVGTVMSRNRFDQIWRYLHLSDNAGDDGSDKLYKLRWFMNFLNDKFMTVYVPDGHFTLDESMIKFKGWLQFRQYMPAIPIKWGVKIWILAESTTGYMSRFQVYTGRDGNDQEHELSHRVVMDLSTHLRGTNVKIFFMDNFYTSPTLLRDLLVRGIFACGTIRANRKGLPVPMLQKNVHLERHEFKVAQFDDLTCAIWRDTKPVLTLSNFHDLTDVGQVKRRTTEGYRQNVSVKSCNIDVYLIHISRRKQPLWCHMTDKGRPTANLSGTHEPIVLIPMQHSLCFDDPVCSTTRQR